MKVCALDLETTGLDHVKDRITEIGATVFEARQGEEFAIEGRFSRYVWDSSYPPQSEEIVALTGITDELLKAEGQPMGSVLKALIEELPAFDAIVAHAAYSLDQPMFYAALDRHREEIGEYRYAALKKILWFCSVVDVQYPKVKTKCRVLSHLALEVGIIVDPSKLHRAVGDTDLLVETLATAKVDLQAALEYAQIPWVIVRALVPNPFKPPPHGDNGVGKDKAKAVGFGWQRAPRTDGPEFKNCWVKRIKENEIEKEKEALGYEVIVLQEPKKAQAQERF